MMNKTLAIQLFEKIEHGDEEHREWLREACVAFFDGGEVPTPRGSGTKDRLYKEIERLREENQELLDACKCRKIREKIKAKRGLL